MREFLSICLRRDGHEIVEAKAGADAVRLLAEHPDRFDLVITDMSMPGVDGMEVLRHARGLESPPPVLVMTAFATPENAVEAMKVGAYDYIGKPFDVDAIRLVIARALERRRLHRENRQLKDELGGVRHVGRMLGRAPVMLDVFELVERAAKIPTTVLIRGESGTGKELVARALHDLSEVRDGPWIPVNCGAIPSHLIESELFGHKKGSFTGATTDREGMFAAAQGGTIFLDEVGELDLAMQVKLLRVLQEHRVRPVGATREIEIDCRVVSATNVDLEAAVESGDFRQDLYFRLNVIQINVPPLRNRREDIPVLVDRFFRMTNAHLGRNLRAISPAALDRFLQYDYPGNVRELQNLVERAVALEVGNELSAAHLPQPEDKPRATASVSELPPSGIDLDAALAQFEGELITKALAQAGDIRRDAARLLGVSLRSLRYRMQKLGLEPTPKSATAQGG